MADNKVMISTTTFGGCDKKPLDVLRDAGLSVTLNPFGRTLKEIEIKGLIKDVDFLIAGTEALSRDVLESAEKLKIISRCGGGVDNVDLKAAKELGIKVVKAKVSRLRTPELRRVMGGLVVLLGSSCEHCCRILLQ